MELCCKQAGWRRPHSPAQLAGGEERDHIGLLVINCCPFLFLWSCFAALFRRKTALVALIFILRAGTSTYTKYINSAHALG